MKLLNKWRGLSFQKQFGCVFGFFNLVMIASLIKMYLREKPPFEIMIELAFWCTFLAIGLTTLTLVLLNCFFGGKGGFRK